jgi:hypothetical protein
MLKHILVLIGYSVLLKILRLKTKSKVKKFLNLGKIRMMFWNKTIL